MNQHPQMSTSYDLIIVSQSRPGLFEVTQRCIDTAREDGADMNVIIVETGDSHQYRGADKYVKYTGDFCYNRALNLGLDLREKEIHILANNDLVFKPGWSEIGEAMKLNGYHSASCVSGHQVQFQRGDFVYPGYVVGYILTGWCLFLDDYCLQQIGKLDEAVSFWYSDNLYACQLKAAGIEHGLFTGYQIDHLASKTLRKQPTRLQKHYMNGEIHKYIARERYYAKRERDNKMSA